VTEPGTFDANFAKPGISFESGPGELTSVVLEHDGARVRLCTHGAHVLSYTPRGQHDVLWLSPQAIFSPGKAIRGGIPVCWPWFSDHQDDPQLPAHGFARTAQWTLIGSSSDEKGKTVDLTLVDDETTRSMWPYAFRLNYQVSLSSVFRAVLRVTNTGDESFCFTEALHSYFSVADITTSSLDGLGGHDYLDKVEGFRRKSQSEPTLRFGAETDRIYLQTEGDCTLDDERSARRIRIRKTGSRSTVVWNPWAARAREMADFPDSDFKAMVCVETANAADAVVELAPGASHTLGVCIESAARRFGPR
jgi:D-hexose-6-phosphate mutarotase